MIKRLLTLVTLTLALQSCVFVVGAAAGAAAITVVYDHRTIANALQDTKIANRISDKIKANPAFADSHIEVVVFNRMVLLIGQASNSELRQKADDLARSVPDAARVYNQITIQGPTSSLTRTSDTWITTKIKTLMLATEDLKSSTIKVVTENGVVYLMGIVNRQQADIAVDIARKVSGVQKVVKIFQYD